MDRSRSANREVNEETLQYKSPQESLLDAELVEDKLRQLLEFIGKLKRNPEGAKELQRRARMFGQCNRSRDDTAMEFYAKLRHWLDRDIVRTKRPLHRPRQMD